MATTIQPTFNASLAASIPALSMGDPETRPAAEAYGTVHDVRSRAIPALERIVSDKGTNSLGKITDWTTVAEHELPRLHEARAKAEANHEALVTKLAQVEAAAAVPTPTTAVDVQTVWATEAWFRAQSPAKQQEMKDKMMQGELIELRDRLLALPEYAFPGTAPMRTLLYKERIAAHVDQTLLARLQHQLDLVTTVRREVASHIAAFEGSADRDRLRAKGINIPKGRGEMSDAEKVAYIDAHGREGFMKLSA